MSPGGYRVQTHDGHDLDEVVSALQKDIRRGNELEALYWAQEMEGKGYWRWLWKRLVIITHEDIGLADPFAAVYVESCRQQYYHYRKVEKSERLDLAIVNAVVYLCRAPKSRMAPHACVCIWEDASFRREIPDYALDEHTQRGRAMGRGLDHFVEEASLLEPRHRWDSDVDQKVADDLEERCIAISREGFDVRPWTRKPISGKGRERKQEGGKQAGLFD